MGISIYTGVKVRFHVNLRMLYCLNVKTCTEFESIRVWCRMETFDRIRENNYLCFQVTKCVLLLLKREITVQVDHLDVHSCSKWLLFIWILVCTRDYIILTNHNQETDIGPIPILNESLLWAFSQIRVKFWSYVKRSLLPVLLKKMCYRSRSN